MAPSETTGDATCRILREQSGLIVSPDKLSKHAVLHFIETDGSQPDPTAASPAVDRPLVEHEFVCRLEDTSGTATEREAMTPTWFSLSEIPVSEMPADDAIFLVTVSAGAAALPDRFLRVQRTEDRQAHA